jgi:hypothetical protein
LLEEVGALRNGVCGLSELCQVEMSDMYVQRESIVRSDDCKIRIPNISENIRESVVTARSVEVDFVARSLLAIEAEELVEITN